MFRKLLPEMGGGMSSMRSIHNNANYLVSAGLLVAAGALLLRPAHNVDVARRPALLHRRHVTDGFLHLGGQLEQVRCDQAAR